MNFHINIFRFLHQIFRVSTQKILKWRKKLERLVLFLPFLIFCCWKNCSSDLKNFPGLRMIPSLKLRHHRYVFYVLKNGVIDADFGDYDSCESDEFSAYSNCKNDGIYSEKDGCVIRFGT